MTRFAGRARSAAPSRRSPAFDAADALVAAAIAQDELPGAVLQVASDGDVVHRCAFGRRQVDRDEALGVDDLFSLASLTKPIVAVGVLQLCDAGRLGLDDPVEKHLPEFSRQRVVVHLEGSDGTVVTRRARTAMTVRHLLSHTAGIHHGFPSAEDPMGAFYERSGVVHGDQTTIEEKVRKLGPLPLVHDPGRGWSYGLASDVAGRLVEVAAGEPLDRYLQRRIFEPLEMRSTCYVISAKDRARLAMTHMRQAGRTTAVSWPQGAHPGGGGGLHSTVADYGRFVQMLLDGNPPIVSRESIAAMTSDQIGSLTALGMKFGLSVGVATEKARGVEPLPVGGFGWYGIHGTWFWALPRLKASVLLFGNVLDVRTTGAVFSRVARAVESTLERSAPRVAP